MRFLSVEPEICLQLPSDSTSRWTPLLFSYTFPTTWACSGLSPVRTRPWRANPKKDRYFFVPVLFAFFQKRDYFTNSFLEAFVQFLFLLYCRYKHNSFTQKKSIHKSYSTKQPSYQNTKQETKQRLEFSFFS